MLTHPKREGGWEVINGALEAGETILEGALRETREEAGEGVQVRPLGTVHVSSFHYDENVEYMLSLGYLMAYEGGAVGPEEDMAGSACRWQSVEELGDEDVRLIVPAVQKQLIERAVELYQLWEEREVELRPELFHPQRVKPKQLWRGMFLGGTQVMVGGAVAHLAATERHAGICEGRGQ